MKRSLVKGQNNTSLLTCEKNQYRITIYLHWLQKKNKFYVHVFILGILFFIVRNSYSQKLIQEAYPFQPIAFNKVKVEDKFWSARIETNRKVTIPYEFRKCEKTGRLDNFAVAAGVKKGKFVGIRYNDSDVFKIIEGASYSLQQHYDPQLDAYLDSIIGLIAGAQEEDGYLYTNRTIDPQNPAKNAGNQRWCYLSSSHELYNVGHMYEAAVAHYLATNKKEFLNVAIRNANLICNVFGPGKIHLVPGHEEIEIGLVRLYGVTGEKKYLDMAKFFLDERGNKKGHKLYGSYCQDHIPVIRQTKAVGHAVRAAYLYCGMADVAAITKDTAYIHAIDKIWSNVVGTKLYITGGIGARHQGEMFGDDYELPNMTAYNETCASIANAMWNYRMFLLHGESKYIDVLERILYNGLISGVSLDGKKFFYVNPLKSDGKYKFNQGFCTRKPWFNCSCCPTNIVRFLPSIPGYIYAMKKNDIYVNLFIGSTASFKVGVNKIELKQETDYPWNGKIKITVNSHNKQQFRLFLRIPSWAKGQVIPSNLYTFSDNKKIKPVLIKINNKKVKYHILNGYAVINRTWENNDEIFIDIPMEIRRIVANEKVEADRGYEAYQRGPIVYCLEGIDNNGNALNTIITNKNKIDYSFMADLLGGVMVLQFKGQQVWENDKTQTEEVINTKLTAIPYYAWSNRGAGSMTVWIPSEKNIFKKKFFNKN